MIRCKLLTKSQLTDRKEIRKKVEQGQTAGWKRQREGKQNYCEEKGRNSEREENIVREKGA